jgi:hypothetical protein
MAAGLANALHQRVVRDVKDFHVRAISRLQSAANTGTSVAEVWIKPSRFFFMIFFMRWAAKAGSFPVSAAFPDDAQNNSPRPTCPPFEHHLAIRSRR